MGTSENTNRSDALYFEYRTAGNDDPKGLPKIFYSCHPGDFEQYFETVWQWLSKSHQAAMFYEPEGQQLDWEHAAGALESMQLIVIPVTTKLLLDDCRTTLEILPYANAEHIPVLPIMMENGLTDLFSAKFGKIQYLSACSTDPTAIPFADRLERFLNSVLISDDTVQKVRKAFEAYIFLSYRKKDRAYAQELMRLIHSYDRYRDFAIWYDEYLVPGEKYSDAIDSALTGSDLFALVVTPALLERYNGSPNYVMRCEFPRAMETGKPVLPVEMVCTDSSRLAEEYAGIPECIPKDADDCLEKAILEKLHTLAMREDSPLHNFFIGLAYLDGIDVEVDRERATRLITGAAESGLEEAARKLTAMYHDGKGVERDYQAALEWRIRLVEILKNQPRENTGLIAELENLGNDYAALGRLDLAERTFEEMQREAEKACSISPAAEARRMLAESHGKLGEICHFQGKPEKAEQWYRKALEERKILAEETGSYQDRKNLWKVYIKTGDAVMSQYGRRAEGSDLFREGAAICETLVKDHPSLDARRCMVLSYRKTGRFEEGIALCASIAKETRTVEDRMELSCFHNNVGIASPVRPLSREHFEKALEIRKELAEETESIDAYRYLAKIYENLGELEKGGQQYQKAADWYSAAAEIRDRIYRQTGSIKSGYELALSLAGSGTVGDSRHLERACSVLDELLTQYPGDQRLLRLKRNASAILHDGDERERRRRSCAFQMDN